MKFEIMLVVHLCVSRVVELLDTKYLKKYKTETQV